MGNAVVISQLPRLIFGGVRLVCRAVNLHAPRCRPLPILLVLCLVACLPVCGDDATNAPTRDASQSFDAGKAFLKLAEEAKTPAQTVDNYQKAIEQFSRAAELAPDSYRAHFLCGHSLSGLALRTTGREARRGLVIQAREQYLAAARCPGVDWLLYQEWGAILTREIDLLAANPAEHGPILQEAINALNAGLNLTRFSGERAKIERDLGAALLMLASNSPGSPNQRALYKQAIEKFESATKVESEAKTARSYSLWGVALLGLGKADNDRMLMRQATERLQTALDMDATNVEIRYNLACAYALLDQPEPGMRHLKICLDNDPDRKYYNTAAKDPDLYNLRRTAEYNQLFPDESSVDPQSIIRSQISDH